jgi:hypothetical protein
MLIEYFISFLMLDKTVANFKKEYIIKTIASIYNNKNKTKTPT